MIYLFNPDKHAKEGNCFFPSFLSNFVCIHGIFQRPWTQGGSLWIEATSWKINEYHSLLSPVLLPSSAAVMEGRVLSKETLICFSPLQISHQPARHPHSQYHSQSTQRVQSQGRRRNLKGRAVRKRSANVWQRRVPAAQNRRPHVLTVQHFQLHGDATEKKKITSTSCWRRAHQRNGEHFAWEYLTGSDFADWPPRKSPVQENWSCVMHCQHNNTPAPGTYLLVSPRGFLNLSQTQV